MLELNITALIGQCLNTGLFLTGQNLIHASARNIRCQNRRQIIQRRGQRIINS